MPSILSEADKETVKRTVPKASNKIQAVAVARLYVAHPDRNKWKYTGLQGAAVLSNDLVGNTFWLKLVDVSPANRGVIWDQEIYDTFAYNQDRTFFHSFELEQCLAGLSFVDEREAKQFMKKMNEREKNASKATKEQPFGSNQQGGAVPTSNGRHHSRIGNFLRGNRHASNPMPVPQPAYAPVTSRPTSEIDLTDPSWRPILEELKDMGITEEQIADNMDFIKNYVAQKQAQEMASGIAQALPERSKAPPPPPPSAPPAMSPQNTGSTTASRRGPPPAPPPSRRPIGGRPPSPPRSSSPPRTPSPESPAQPSFRVPPFADAGKFAVPIGRDLHPSGRQRASSNLANPGPPPPPRPPKVEEDSSSRGFRVSPPFTGDRKSSAPPAPPARGPVPPPPPSRDAGPPPPLPPKTPAANSSYVPPPPPPPPNRNNGPPSLPPPNARPIPPPPVASSSPPLPPPALPSSSGPPPPPPMPNMGGPPPPPPMPVGSSAPSLPQPTADRGGLLSEIRGTGGAGVLKKVPDHVKRDRSAAAVPGGASDVPPPPGGAPASPAGGLANALNDALNKRKKKVSCSDDEREDDDDW